MPFPDLPFSFPASGASKSSEDEELIRYLKNTENFSYLSPNTRTKVNRIDSSKDLTGQKEEVKALWTMVLTDALSCLKKNDQREYEKNKIDFDSFFDTESLGIPQVKDLLDAFAKFETLMYGANPERYRDHIAHTLRVWLIGHGILMRHFGGKLLFDEELNNRSLERMISTEEWQAIWCVAALCHDIGYPLTTVREINLRARDALEKQGLQAINDLRFEFSPQVQPLQEILLKLMSSRLVVKSKKCFLTHLQNKYYMKFTSSFDQLKHGVISALLLGKFSVYFRESDYCNDGVSPLSRNDARQFVIRREILRAIAAHTCPDIYFLRFNSLAFLLYMVDEIQCWGRPTFEQYMGERGLSTQNDKVTVERFSRKEIRITVDVRDGWKKRDGAVRHQLMGLKRRLRLAVDAARYQDIRLSYVMKGNQNGKKVTAGLRLDGFKIHTIEDNFSLRG